MTAWMLYSALCALGFALAALLAERVWIGRGPVRLLWVGSIAFSLLVPIVAYARSEGVEPATDVTATTSEGPFVQTVSEEAEATASDGGMAPSSNRWSPSWAALSRFDGPAGILWLLLSMVLTLNFLGSLATLRLMRRRWEERMLLGSRVFVSDVTGPAVVGVFSPMIVVPRWVLELSQRQLELMLKHEEEHRRAGDGQLLTLVELALIAMPWNLALWWQVRRLRAAVELDCDGRVLRDFDARPYGDLLVEMARRGRGPRMMGAIAFAERAVHLERRILLLPTHSARARRGPFALATCIGLAAFTVAWAGPTPPPIEGAPAAVDVTESIPTPPDDVTSRAPSAVPAAPTVAEAPAELQPGAGETVLAPMAPASETSSACSAALGTPVAPLVDSAFTRLFARLTPTREERAGACRVLGALELEQRTRGEAARASGAVATDGVRVRIQRDSALLSILDDDGSRSVLAARLAPGARGGGAGSAAAAGTTRPEGTGRVGGTGRQAGGGVASLEATADAVFRRLFNGIELTASQETQARSVILDAQQALSALRTPQLISLGLNGGAATVLVRAPSDAELLDLLSDPSDRSLLRSRIVTLSP